jgi:hypothetical protein
MLKRHCEEEAANTRPSPIQLADNSNQSLKRENPELVYNNH